MTPEFSRMVDSRHLRERALRIEANAAERGALATRFGIEGIERLAAEATFARIGAAVVASGSLDAAVTQACAVSGEPFAVTIAEPLELRFVPAAAATAGGDEIELDAADCDEIAFEGHLFDFGEAVAQTLALALDPYAEGPEADRVRREAGLLGEDQAGPFAALAVLRDSSKG